MKYRIIKLEKEEREKLLKKDNFRKKCYLLTNLKIILFNISTEKEKIVVFYGEKGNE